MVRLSLAWSIPAVAIAAFAMYAAWQHNPQGEFHSVSGIEWKAWLGLGLFWFLGVLFVVQPAITRGLYVWNGYVTLYFGPDDRLVRRDAKLVAVNPL
jgi:hypothetical protein